MPNTVVVITGGFDPLHSGHLSYIDAARQMGDTLVVGVNSDEWLARKKGRSFMPFEERISIVQTLRGVDYAIPFDDSDNSAKDAIYWARKVFPESKIIFANGGDRTLNNIPEMDADVDNIDFVFGVGGENKANSSSWILEEWKAPKTLRQWGYYRVLHENGPGVKVKELVVDPGKSLSMQRHFNRAEFWFVSEGTALLKTLDSAIVYKTAATLFKLLLTNEKLDKRNAGNYTIPTYFIPEHNVWYDSKATLRAISMDETMGYTTYVDINGTYASQNAVVNQFSDIVPTTTNLTEFTLVSSGSIVPIPTNLNSAGQITTPVTASYEEIVTPVTASTQPILISTPPPTNQ